MSAGWGKKPIINAKYTLTFRKKKKQKSFLLLMGKPFDNKPCDKYQRHNFNVFVKKTQNSFKSEFRNTQKTTLASYKSSRSSSYTEDAYAYVSFPS